MDVIPDSNASKRAEMEKKTAALKNIIYNLIKKRDLGMAAQILDSYQGANPSDPDIRNIRKMIESAGAEGQGRVPLPDKMALLEQVETVFILSRMFVVPNGIMNSVLRKVKLMEEHWAYHTTILVCDHDMELHGTELAFKTAWRDVSPRMKPGTKMIGVYDYFQGSYREGLVNRAVHEKVDDGLRREDEGRGIYNVYDGDVLVRKEYFTGHNGILRLAERIEKGKPTEGTYYDDWGYKNLVREYTDGPYVTDSYYNVDGDICIKAKSKSNDVGGYDIEKLTVYDGNGGIIKECDGNAGLAALCLERLITDDKFHMLVVENGLMATAVLPVNKRNAAKAAVIHSKFLENSYDLASGPQYYYKDLCDNADRFDAIVLLTHAARKDFFKKYGSIRKLFTIPHPYPDEVARADFNERDHRKAVIVARLDASKDIPAAIEIFAEAVKKLPDIRLEIYGLGSQRETCDNKIKELHMENNVFLKGHTQNPWRVFQGAALSMMTSTVEGFGLTLAESICNGCPAFAFDIKYGPSEVIDDNKTGCLIPAFDRKLYAAKLISYFEDIETQRTMSENAYNQAQRFGPDAFLESWYGLTEALFNKAASGNGGIKGV